MINGYSIFSLFFAGALAVLAFHQGAWTILNRMGWAGPPFPIEPTKPLGVPQVWSLVAWGGVWGIIFGLALPWFPLGGVAYWVTALLFGAFLPTVAFLLIVAPLKGIAIDRDPKRMAVGPIVNGAWGLGTALLLWWQG